MTTLRLKKSISRSPLRRGFPIVLLVLGLLALSRTARAVDPPPDGGYPFENTAEGDNALLNLNGGSNNTAIGFSALLNDGQGNSNTAVGHGALFSNTFGNFNTATGVSALLDNTTGSNNTATGVGALINNSSGHDNTATGIFALGNNTFATHNTGSFNTATGASALYDNTTGKDNTATGAGALHNNTTGSFNTANGFDALYHGGTHSTATGYVALVANTGTFNTAYGDSALQNNTTGSFNTAVGFNAGSKLTTGSSNIDIGSVGVAGESNTIRIGGVNQTSTFIAGIQGVAVTGTPVVVSSGGQLGVAPSSERFKEAIKLMDKASEAILSLQPVTFRYKQELDPDGIPQFGLVAEQVEKVNPNLVVRGEDGKVMTVRYEAVNAMLLNEFLKEHRKVEEQEITIDQLKAAVAKQQEAFGSKIAQQQKQIETLAAGLKKVSATVELNKPAPTQVADNR